MKKLTLVTVFILSLANCYGRKLPFSSKGTMGTFRLNPDTLITGINHLYSMVKGKILLKKIDSSVINEQVFADYWNPHLKYNDSTDYFFLFNGTDTTINIGTINNELTAISSAENREAYIYPTSIIISRNCGSGLKIGLIAVKPGNILIIKSRKESGNFRTKGYIRIKASSGRIIISKAFDTSINISSFSLSSDLRYMIMNKRFTFLDQ